ncbi:hypothetical protein EYZ11_004423 [Aspergillus tanneri]|uniref:F-box domain-containing protein n=1 Tax=Aspergillus tanneri TaxID=1220188 RepID=A0A4S3JRH0_9EURO|nr:hypothetical protein EYZ11_004423 [Aspergillus tanneri]
MSMHVSWLESLPNELIDEIISYLLATSPSHTSIHQPPSTRIAKGGNRWLKNLSRSSSRILEVVRPRLFSHACFNLTDVEDFLSFVSTSDLHRHITSIVVRGRHSPNNAEDPFWWRQVLRCLDPQRVTVLAPPSFIGMMLGAKIYDGHSWAFDVPFQIVQLEQDSHSGAFERFPQMEECSNLLEARRWSSMVFNESSSLKVYNHYEYYLFQVPSIFSKWGTMASIRPLQDQESLSNLFKNLSSFRYTAVFPFYNHVKLVLNAVELMTNLRSLSFQLAPCANDKATEIEQRGSMDPSDPWMELATGYSLIASAVKDMGDKGPLCQFTASIRFKKLLDGDSQG